MLTKIMGKSRILHLFSDFFDFSECGYNDTLMKIFFRIASCVYKKGDLGTIFEVGIFLCICSCGKDKRFKVLGRDKGYKALIRANFVQSSQNTQTVGFQCSLYN